MKLIKLVLCSASVALLFMATDYVFLSLFKPALGDSIASNLAVIPAVGLTLWVLWEATQKAEQCGWCQQVA